MLMKKHLFAVACALLIPFAAHAQPVPNDIGGTAADPDDNQQLQDVYLTTDEIVIDGDLSEWSFNNPIIDPLIGIPKVGRDGRVEGDPPSEYVIHEELGGTWTGPDDQSSTLQFAWKTDTEDGLGDGLYMGLIVTDDYHENAAASGWNGDSVQMMVTFYDQDLEEHDPGDFALYNFALGGVEEELDPEDPVIVAHLERQFSFFGPPDDFVEIAIARDAERQKTFYELFLGLDALGLDEMEVGTQLGIGMSINDGDDGEGQNGQKGWVGLGAHAIVFGKTPNDVALLTLADEFVGPACDPNTLGDLDGNGKVEFADFLVLAENFGKDASDHTTGDIDCNGKVEFADFLILAENFGASTGEASAVPEPSTFGLFGVSVLCLGYLRRRRNR